MTIEQTIHNLNKIKPNNKDNSTDYGNHQIDLLSYIKTPRITLNQTETTKVNKAFRAYRKQVREQTERNKHLIPDIETRGFKSYHIDHKISIWDGYHKGLPVEQIADINNLRLIPYKENMLKGKKSIID